MWKAIKRFFRPDPFQDGIDYIMDHWHEIKPRYLAFLNDLSVSEQLCGGGPYEDGLREGIRRCMFIDAIQEKEIKWGVA